jgi:uncharacterized membrane protein
MQPTPSPPRLGPAILPIDPWRPFTWLQRGWRDVCRRPWLGIGHGAVLALGGLLLAWLARHHFWWLAGSVSGFLLIAPILATGLYAVSRALARGEPADLDTVVRVWRSLDRRLVAFGIGLALAGTGWWLTSAALITLFAPVPISAPTDFLRHVVIAPNWLFEGWLMLGGLMAAPVFASSVVAIPMLLDRPVGVYEAVLTSWRAVMANPLPMAVWAALVMGLTLLGLLAVLVGVAVVVPVLGHASWYAYCDLVGPDAAGADGGPPDGGA